LYIISLFYCNICISSSQYGYVHLTTNCLPYLFACLLTQLLSIAKVVPSSFQYPGSHPTMLQDNIANSNSTTSKAPAELWDPGVLPKSKQDERNLPSKSSSQLPVPDGRVPDATVATNGSAEQLPMRDASSEVEQQAGEVTISSSGKSINSPQ